MIPKFEFGDVVKFDIKTLNGKTSTFTGYVLVVDRCGMFEQHEEPSYDILELEMNTLFKRITEHTVEFVRKPTKKELEKISRRY